MSVALPIFDTQPIRSAFAQGPRRLESVKLLRISVTDRCQFRCVYCMPDEGLKFSDRDDVLSRDDLVAVADAALSVGITHLKITGGEPTVRGDPIEIVEAMSALGLEDMSLTTNGMSLHHQAADLRRAGLDRLTISWDTMQPDRFARIARGAARDGEASLEKLRAGRY